MLSVKAFNEKHRAIAAVTTFFALLLIAIISALFSIAIFVCSLFGKSQSTGKRIAGIVLAGVLLCVAVFAAQRITRHAATEPRREAAEEISAEQDTAAESTEQVIIDTAVADTTEAQTGTDQQASMEQPVSVESASAQAEVATEPTKQAETTETGVVDSNEATTEVPAGAQTETATEPTEAPSPQPIGWIYFEDGHINYPIMQADDNEKYRKLDTTGKEAPTGAIFLDYRSSADFMDSNSIIYGHNMKDGTMFGSLREYRKDPAYYNDHQYFLVITPTKAYRYLIFEYMDVPETYVLYDYVSDAALEFVKDAEPVRIKSYMDSEIPVNIDSKVVTLSTCTRKDDLQFVVLGVMVEETDSSEYLEIVNN